VNKLIKVKIFLNIFVGFQVFALKGKSKFNSRVSNVQSYVYYGQKKFELTQEMAKNQLFNGSREIRFVSKEYKTPPAGQKFSYPVNNKKFASFKKGSYLASNNALDIAILSNGFFVLEGGILTRNGEFVLKNGVLFNKTYSLPVLDQSDEAISFDSSVYPFQIKINKDGSILVKGQLAGKIKVVKIGSEYEALPNGCFVSQNAEDEEDVQLQQGMIEESSIDSASLAQRSSQESLAIKEGIAIIASDNADFSKISDSLF
jgi:flagellar basal body rod protein FlgG